MFVRRDSVGCGWVRNLCGSGLFCLLLLGSANLWAGAEGDDCTFVRGEVNNLDGLDVVDLNDGVEILAYLYLGVSVPACPAAADVNDNGIIEPGDYLYLVQFLFQDGPPPPAPYPDPGTDPTPGVTLPGEPDEGFRFAIGRGAAVPSNTGIEIPLTMSNAEPVAAFQMVLGYNGRDSECPDLLIQEIRTEENTLPSAESAEYIIAEFDNVKGTAFVGVLDDFATPFHFHDGTDGTLPAGEDQLVATIVVAVSVCADMGFAPIEFADDRILARQSLSPDESLARGHNLVVLADGRVLRPTFAEAGGVEIRRGFVRGDANKDDSVDIGDPVFLLDYIFRGGPVPPCLDSADTNNDTRIDISDPIFLLSYLFTGGPQPSEPYPQAGVDPSDDGSESLGCASDGGSA